MNDPSTYKKPIIVIGAGGIVNTAHLPAYRMAGFEVAGIYDVNKEKAIATAQQFKIPVVFDSTEQVVEQSPANVVFDVAVPGAEMIKVLQYLPPRAAVLMQKPMGNDYTAAKKIVQIVHDKQMT